MKKILLYSAVLFGLVFTSCKSDEEMILTNSRQKGEVAFHIQSADVTRAETTLDYLIRIYSENGLIRMYNSLDAMPETLSLLSGNYTIDVVVGNSAPASFTSKSYHGEESFTVVAGQMAEVEVVCPLLNAAVEVNYSDAVVANFNDGFVTTVALGKNSLEYGSSMVGYFLPSETEKTIVWNFEGEHPEKGVITQEGTFDIETGKKYTLNFNYSEDAPGFLDFTITVEEPTPENGGDVIIFSAEPQYKSSEFNLDEAQVIYGATRTFTVSAPNALTSITVEVDGQTFDLGNSTVDGVTVEKSDEKNWNVTISEAFFASMAGGNHDLNFVATDSEGGEGKKTMVFVSQGIVPAEASDYDLWLNTGSIRVKVYDSSVSTVSVKLRREGGDWATYAATRQDSETFAAAINPQWNTTTNDKGDTAYTPDTTKGIFANTNYEAMAIIDGVEQAAVAKFTTTVDQVIPYATFEDSTLSCFSMANANAPVWGSGNSLVMGNQIWLCTQQTLTGMGGSACAKCASQVAMGLQLAAGNLFTGTYSMAGTTGTVKFGIDYDWKARPKAIRFKYAAKVGEVDYEANTSNAGNPLRKGDDDCARFYAAIVDWDTQHVVTSGLSAPTGMWDPATQTSTDEGPIIAYASLWIESGVNDTEMKTIELPMIYYDKLTKPDGQYKLLISFAANAYGDYMTGCSTNYLYVDDIEWVY